MRKLLLNFLLKYFKNRVYYVYNTSAKSDFKFLKTYKTEISNDTYYMIYLKDNEHYYSFRLTKF